jgi:glycosyltransferase involved in cell wall biosynthesis
VSARVAVVADGSGFGGAQVYARSLVLHAPPGLRCDVVTTDEHAARLAPAAQSRGGRVVVVPTTVRRPEAPELRAALERLAPDLVQVNLVDPTSMLAALEAATAAAPTVATLHMRGAVAPPDLARVRAAYAGLQHLVAVSREFAALAREVLHVERLTHVLNGVDPVEPVRRPGGPVPVVAALGRLTLQKGFDVLLDAVRLLVADGVRLQVLLGGEGREREALERRAAGLPVGFTGFADEPRRLFARADVFVLPSRVEALPLVLVEAVSAGLPAVATDVGDVREALGGVVELVPPEDAAALARALRRLLADPADRDRRSRAGITLARERLTAERMAREAWTAFLPAAPPDPSPHERAPHAPPAPG